MLLEVPRIRSKAKTALVAAAVLAACGSPSELDTIGQRVSALSSNLVIAEVYGGGGLNTGGTPAPYSHDFVVLFNRDSAPVNLKDFVLQYASPTNNFSNKIDLPDHSLDAGQYFLIRLGTDNAAISSPVPNPDLTPTAATNIGGTNGKLALARASKPLSGCGGSANPCPAADIVDLLGYGTASQA
ncbi:MAG TPA: lamin tail domain-containing protein, partial [Polyangiaceae bacterium]|nr:lamin tail domain-containing protein [Polyangiaceae bacterium]